MNHWVWLAGIAAVLLFWSLGAYNRLVRLRAAVSQAFGALDEQLVRQLVWIQGNLPAAIRDAEGAAGQLEADAPAAASAPVANRTADDAADAADAAEPVPNPAFDAWTRLSAAATQLAAALAQARAQPLAAEPIASLVMAHEALRTAWAGVLSTAIAADATPSADRLQERWMRLLHQSLPLRARFNEAAQQYNQAIGQFPASLLAASFRFTPAGLLARMAEGR